MSTRRQLVTFPDRSVDFRIGAGALEEFSRLVSGVVVRPQRALVVSALDLGDERLIAVERGLIDTGFTVAQHELDADRPFAVEDTGPLFDRLAAKGFTADDLIVAIGSEQVCALVSWCAHAWCGGMAAVFVPTTLAAMACATTRDAGLAVGGVAGMASLPPAPEMTVCDLAPVMAESDPEQLRPGYVELVRASLADSVRAWERLRDETDVLLSGDEIFLITVLGDAQSTGAQVASAPNPSSRYAFDFGVTSARALRACLGAEVPWHQLVAEGMRFEARLAVEVEDLDTDIAFELDDVLEALGVDELAFTLDATAFVEALKRERFRRANRLMFALPRYAGTIRLSTVEDEVLMRHARAYLAAKAELV